MGTRTAVSVILPIKNGMDHIEKAKTSLLENCSNSDEILLIDDSSTDGTSDFLRRWAADDSRVRVLHNSGFGLVDALNLALKESSHDWIARVDVDDTYAPNRIEEQVRALNKDTVAIFSDYRLTSPKVQDLGIITTAVFPSAVSLSLVSSQRTPHPSVIFNKIAAAAAGGYRKIDFPAEDLSLWLRMSRLGQLISIPNVLLNYQISPGSISSNRRNEMVEKRNHLLLHFGINQKDILNVISSWEDFASSYDEMSWSTRRKILMYRDLRIHSSLFPNVIRDKKVLKLMRNKLITDIKTIPSLAGLKYEQFLRSKVRH
jgi:glycosyltransferase involved in cell wall biosynthesis